MEHVHKANPSSDCASCRDRAARPAQYQPIGAAPRKKGTCLWCRHPKASHDGRTPEATKAQFIGTVKWTPSSCSHPGCGGCRRYEA